MARYDRIAPMPAPPREAAYPGWLVLRDLEGRERDPELGRRARLRCLALRPLRRVLARGIDAVPAESWERQLEGIREELGHLSARDPERAELARYLRRIADRTPANLVAAALDLGEIPEKNGHYWAAEEFYRTAFELADAYGLGPERTGALRRIGRVCRKTARWEEAERLYRKAIDLAAEAGDRQEWARATDGLGLVFSYQGNYPKARKIFEELLERGKEWDDAQICAMAYNSLCYNALTAGEAERALEYGWTAIGLMRDEEERYPIFGNLGLAFAQLGLYQPAERCFTLVMERSEKILTRGKAQIEYAVVAAEAGDVATFRTRRKNLLKQAGDWSGEPWLTAQMHLHVGRGCLLVGDLDLARTHLREAVRQAAARRYNELLIRGEELLKTLERAIHGGPYRVSAARPGAVAHRIAGEVASYEGDLVPARARD